jgi:hypothetical protein
MFLARGRSLGLGWLRQNSPETEFLSFKGSFWYIAVRLFNSQLGVGEWQEGACALLFQDG